MENPEMKIVGMVEVGLGKRNLTLAELRYAIQNMRVSGFMPCEILIGEEPARWLTSSVDGLWLGDLGDSMTVFGIPILVRDGEAVIRGGRVEYPAPVHFPATIAIHRKTYRIEEAEGWSDGLQL